jgi:glycosyltransferase involved in cell wall biosynthesis
MYENYPKITIVTPSFNQGDYLEDTINSILDQGYPNLEYIIIDGGSTDNSIDIIRKYESKLAYWVSEKDEGLYDGIQKGFARSTGDIMGWINSDDMHHKKSLITIAQLFYALPAVNWIMGKNTFYDEEGKMFVFDTDMFHERWSKWKMYDFDGMFIQQESVFWRRTLWEKSGAFIDSSLSLAGDADLWLRFFRHDKLYSTTFLLAGFRFRNGNQKSKDQRNEYVAELKMLIQREKELGNGAAYLLYVRFIRYLAKFIPMKKYRNMLVFKTMKIPPKLMYAPEKGYHFLKNY